MNGDPKSIANEIVALVTQLAALAGAQVDRTPEPEKGNAKGSGKKDKSGATGALRQLVDDGKFDLPRQMPQIRELLSQEGKYYPRSTIAMGLMYLLKARILTRFRDGGGKSWKYAVRR